MLPLSQAIAIPGKRAAKTSQTSRSAPASAKKKQATAKRQSAKRSTSPGRAAGKTARVKTTVPARSGKSRVAKRRSGSSVARARATPAARLSFGHQAGLQRITGPLGLESSAALVIDQDSREVLLQKNDRAVLPIASLTKLMTGMVMSSAQLPLDERITITEADVDTLKGSRSRLAVGTTLTRGELMHLALMSSENRAAHALARTFPGGMARFVGLMNARAATLGMADTRYVEPTGLSSDNHSSARDLATLVAAAYQDPMLRRWTTSPGYEVAAIGGGTLEYRNTNGLLKDPDWDIGVQKTGYIWEAGHCLVMQTKVEGRNLVMVFLDSSGRYSHVEDAVRVRQWIEHASVDGAPVRVAGGV